MSIAELNAIIENDAMLDREQAIDADAMPEGIANRLAGRGIRTVGALLDTDAFRAVTSGRYDIDTIREVNGIPIAALRWLLDDVIPRSADRAEIPAASAL